ASHGQVFVITKDFKRYVGAQIGVYNPSGDKVGEVSHLRNEEYIYLVARPQLCERIPDALARLEQLAARVDSPPPSAEQEDRVTLVARALRELGEGTRSELQTATGLSPYQTKMALESLLGQGLARVDGDRRKRYSMCEINLP